MKHHSRRNEMKPPPDATVPVGRYNPSMEAKNSSSPAKTASIGDREMMTYMKMSIPSHSLERNATPSNTDSDDARFLDGLFERLSGSSDNGSDKGKDDPGSSSGSSNSNNQSSPSISIANVSTNSPKMNSSSSVPAISAVRVPSTQQQQDPLTAFNLTGQDMRPRLCGTSDISSLTTSSHTNAPVTALPQHLMNAGAFSPQNLLNLQPQQNQQQLQNLNLLNSNSSAIQNTMQQQFNSWMMSPPVSAATAQAAAAFATAGINPAGLPMVQQIQQQQAQLQIQHQQQNVAQLSSNGSLLGTNPALQVQMQQQQQPQVFQEMIPAMPFSSSNVNAARSSSQPHPHIPVTSSPRRKKQRYNAPLPTVPYPTDNIADEGIIVSSISEDEGDNEKRRRDRNQREQSRSKRIATQISDLKRLLVDSDVPFKPDKYSTLVSVHTYIKTLQQRAALLDEEHRKLVDTITESNELVHKSQHGYQAVRNPSSPVPEPQYSASGHVVIPTPGLKNPEEDELLVFVRGLDYKSVFSKVRIALCVTSVDGQLLNCNDEFVRACGLQQDTLVAAGLKKPDEKNSEEMEHAGKQPLAFFNLLAREDMHSVFEAMSGMLKTIHKEAAVDDKDEQIGIKYRPANIKSDHWSSEIHHCHNSSQKVSYVLYTIIQVHVHNKMTHVDWI